MGKDKLNLFIDANIFIAAVASNTGGSFYLLKACQKGIYQAVTTKLILEEAKKNILLKLSEKAYQRFIKLIKSLPLEIQPPGSLEEKQRGIITLKDEHVLAAALESRSDFLITLDKKHFFTSRIKQAKLPIKISTPKDFIQNKAL